jgi:hypothetical protein
LHIAQGVTALTSTPLKAGDIVLGYSLGSVVASAYLNSHTPPRGVRFILLGDTSNPHGMLATTGLLPLFGGGIPPDTRAPVTIINRQYDGWADWPNNIFALGYGMAVINAVYGTFTIHNDYTEASLLNNGANVTWTRGNITYELVPTQNLPINRSFRDVGLGWVADVLDALERPLIDAAYTNRPSPTAAQLAASTSEQAVIPSPIQIPGPPEPVATLKPPRTTSMLASSPNQTPTPAPVTTLNPPRTASVLASSPNQTPTPAPATVATNLVASASTVSDLTAAPRPAGVGSEDARVRGSISSAKHERGNDQVTPHEPSRRREPQGQHGIAAPHGLSGDQNDGGDVSGRR